MSRPSIERVLAKAGPDRYSPPSDEERADALAAAVEDGPLIDRDRSIAVIRLDPELAQFLTDWADDIWESGDLRAADHADALEKAARMIGGADE